MKILSMMLQHMKKNKKIIAFDLDDVLCTRDSSISGIEKYLSCEPIQEMINVCNQCYDDGFEIIIYTARGMSQLKGDVSKIYSNLYNLTLDQLERWGVKFDQLVMGKIHYDLLIDDKALRSDRVNSIGNVKEVLR